MAAKTPKVTESDTRKRVREMAAKGWIPRDIALELGITTQAVYEHLRKIRESAA